MIGIARASLLNLAFMAVWFVVWSSAASAYGWFRPGIYFWVGVLFTEALVVRHRLGKLK